MKPSHRTAAAGEKPTAPGETPSLEPKTVIRTETVLSKLPIHQLAKRGNVPIRILQKNEDGSRVELKWEVRGNPLTGEPRALAYKLDTLIINRRIDELGHQLPRLVRLGSLHQIAQELGLGRDTSSVRKALEQNADTIIIAKFSYTAADGEQYTFESRNTRYGLYFLNSSFPDGTKADAVYLELNSPWYEHQRRARRRPLDYDYMKSLPPAAQRWYELGSYAYFPALKRGLPHAELRYSQLCTEAPLTRFSERSKMQAQMARVHRPHKKAGYIESVQYQPTKDEEGRLDWLLRYRPGPKAWAEFSAFNKRRKSQQATNPQPQERLPELDLDPDLLRAFTQRGIGEPEARNVVASATSIEDLERLEDSLAYWDGEKRRGRDVGQGLLYQFATGKRPLPDTFETKAQRREREEEKARQRQQGDQEAQDYIDLSDYHQAATTRAMGEHREAYLKLFAQTSAEVHRSDTFADRAACKSSKEAFDRHVNRKLSSQLLDLAQVLPRDDFLKLSAQERRQEIERLGVGDTSD